MTEAPMDKILMIGIAGGTGSGKTTITNELIRRFGDRVSVVYHDNYYRNFPDLSEEERHKLNYDAPEAFETELMIEQLKELAAGHSVECPIYDFTLYNRSNRTVTVKPNPVIIVEGILIFCDPLLCDLFDIKIFVDTDADVRILRRIKRDVIERGRTIESVEKQYLETVKPMHELYVEPSKRKADIIVPEGGKNFVALEMIMNRIASHIEK